MIRVDFALNHRLFVLAFAALLVGVSIVAFHNRPINAYPNVADNYVEIITHWLEISVEQVEQQVTIPLENCDEQHFRKSTICAVLLFGLSDRRDQGAIHQSTQGARRHYPGRSHPTRSQ